MIRLKKAKEKDQLSISFKPAMITLGFIFLAFYLLLDMVSVPLDSFLYKIVCVLKDISQIGISSIAISAIINHTDLKRQYKEMENLLKSVKQEIDENYNFLQHPEVIPYEEIENENLEVLLSKSTEQRINNIKWIKEYEPYGNYVKTIGKGMCYEIKRLERGYVNKSYSRTIVITPDSQNKTLHIKTIIKFERYIPSNINRLEYKYMPRFNNKKEAESLKISTCLLNGIEQGATGNIKELKKGTYSYIFEKRIKFKVGQINEILLISEYNYILQQMMEFHEIYRVEDTCCSYMFKCQIEGGEKDEWICEIEGMEMQFGKANKNKSLTFSETKKDKTLETREGQWIVAGSSINLIVKQRN